MQRLRQHEIGYKLAKGSALDTPGSRAERRSATGRIARRLRIAQLKCNPLGIVAQFENVTRYGHG